MERDVDFPERPTAGERSAGREIVASPLISTDQRNPRREEGCLIDVCRIRLEVRPADGHRPIGGTVPFERVEDPEPCSKESRVVTDVDAKIAIFDLTRLFRQERELDERRVVLIERS